MTQLTDADRARIADAAMLALGEWLSWPDAARDGPREVTVDQTVSFLGGLPQALATRTREASTAALAGAADAFECDRCPMADPGDCLYHGHCPHRDGPLPDWRCFHCGEVFTDRLAAATHFGADEGKRPACLIKGAEGGLLKALRDAEAQADEAIQLLHDESTDAAKAYHRQRCRHTQALMSAEEAGYERGMRDGRALSTPSEVNEPDLDTAALMAEVERLREAVDWRDIGSAPKDGTTIDAWRDGTRETVYWGFPPHTCGEMGEYCDSDWHSLKAPGWICSTFGEYVGGKHNPFTHWRPLDAGPAALSTPSEVSEPVADTIGGGEAGRQVRNLLIGAGVHETVDTAVGLVPYPVAAQAVRDALRLSTPQPSGDAVREALEEAFSKGAEWQKDGCDPYRIAVNSTCDAIIAALAALNGGAQG